MMATCAKCGPGVPQAFFNKSGTICDECWEIHDMGRLEEAKPKKGDRPTAKAIKLTDGIGVICPHCDHKTLRKMGYYHRDPQTERCPKCMEHYLVRKGKAI